MKSKEQKYVVIKYVMDNEWSPDEVQHGQTTSI